MSIKVLYNELEASRLAWQELNDMLVSAGYAFSKERPLLDQQSMDVFRRKVDLVFEVFFSLRPQEDNDVASLVIGSKLWNCEGSYKTLNVIWMRLSAS